MAGSTTQAQGRLSNQSLLDADHSFHFHVSEDLCITVVCVGTRLHLIFRWLCVYLVWTSKVKSGTGGEI